MNTSWPRVYLSFLFTFLHKQPPSTSSAWELTLTVTWSHSLSRGLTNWWNESQHLKHWPTTSTKYWSNPDQLWAPYISAHSLDHGLQAHLQSCNIKASKCVCNLAWLWLPSVSLTLLYYSLQVHLQAHSIMDYRCLSRLTRFQPAC